LRLGKLGQKPLDGSSLLWQASESSLVGWSYLVEENGRRVSGRSRGVGGHCSCFGHRDIHNIGFPKLLK
jgi:hypothetical protein